MMAAATRPELFGPIIVAGSPLSYWAGVRGKNPMRYTGGLLGRQLAHRADGRPRQRQLRRRLAGANFENLNPANTLWTKQYNLYSKVDTEAPRYLGFEQWWGGHVLLNAEEMQYIVDKLFVGNKLPPARSSRPTARASTCATSARPSSSSARRATTSRRRSRRWAGSSTSTRASTRSARTARPSSTAVHETHRPSRHLRLGLRGEEGARRVREQHRPHRRAAARPLRGGDDAEGRRRCGRRT